jgi:WD40 repeat protein
MRRPARFQVCRYVSVSQRSSIRLANLHTLLYLATPMNRAFCIFALLVLPSFGSAQEKAAATPVVQSFPAPDFILRDKDLKPQKGGVVLGPMESDGKGGTKGSFAIYGGSSLIQVGSLAFSADGRILAVGSTPGRVDLWGVDNRKKLGTLDYGTVIALSADGRLLATYGKGIEICNAANGKLIRRIPWSLSSSTPGVEPTIEQLAFDPSGNLLLVSSNGEDDLVFSVSSGRLVATLTFTQRGKFSPDGAFVVGGNSKHLIEWNAKDWTKASDVLNGPDYVTQIADFPERDLAVVGGPNEARLVHLSSGEEVAKVGLGYTNFAAFSDDGTLIVTDSSSGFGVWDTTGKQYCYKRDLGNGTVALSPDGRWLAAAVVDGGTSVAVWNFKSALSSCGVPSLTKRP